MRYWSKLAVIIIALGLLGMLGGFILPQLRYESSATPVNITDTNLIAKGKYIAQTADCIACHTTLNGKPFAGGLPMLTPLGAIYSTNITPDKATGIGNYSFEQFKNAVKHGIRADKSALYPAMPYPSYQIMSDDEIAAMYAYFMSAMPAVQQANKPSELPPILNWRWPLSYWQAIFARPRTFNAESNDTVLSRGQYLVEGAGHCGSCHTERGIGYQEVTLTNQDPRYLSGAVIDGWRAKSLRGEAQGLGMWSTQELVDFFKTGRTQHTAAFGAMADVVEHSTQYWHDDDLVAMATYLKTLTPVNNQPVKLPNVPDTTTDKLLNGNYDTRGGMLYAEYCQVCHRADGKGMPRIFPALAANSAVIADNPESILQIILSGGRMPITPYDKMAFTMPEFKQLGDNDIVEITNFIRTNWGNQAKLVTTKDVIAMRQFLAKKPVIATDLPQSLDGDKIGKAADTMGGTK